MNSSAPNRSQRKPSNQNIQVYVRVRPLNTRERHIRSNEVVEVVSPREIVARHALESKQTKKFTFDRAFGPESRQVELYTTVVAPLIDEVLAGYNCTVFAYGQTGTGKTHTMVGTECAELKSSWEDDSEIGIIPRALSHLFDELRMLEVEFSMRISYLELYNEELCDLLSSDDNPKIRIYDDSNKKGSVIINGLEEISVHSKDDVYKLLEKGKERRRTATTLMNAQSSRSHTVFSILVHIRENGLEGEEMLKIGKLNLVDLAGSENVSKSGNEKGIRVRETVNINQSLLTLGRVITALVERTPHIPYRESKLTRLLQESLGGRTKTSIIATISPGHKDIEETLSTLEYAHRAKNIQNKPEVNQKLTKKTMIREYTEEIDKLKRDLMAARDKNGFYLAEETYNEMTTKMDSQNRELNEKMVLLKALKDELQQREKIFNDVTMSLLQKEQKLQETTGALMDTRKMLYDTKRYYIEKKLILESHVKTEEELANQATQILDVADKATSDAHQLHNTLERRKDNDQEIKNALEKFTKRMHDRFATMEENLNELREQHNSTYKSLLEEFAGSVTAQGQMLKESNEKIKSVGVTCESFSQNITETREKYMNLVCERDVNHKELLGNLLQELQAITHSAKEDLQTNLAGLAEINAAQSTVMTSLTECVMSSYESGTTALEEHKAHLQQNFDAVIKCHESTVQHVAAIGKAMSEERSMAERHQAIIDECLQQIQALNQQRATCANQVTTLSQRIGENTSKSIQQLRESSVFTDNVYKKRCIETTATAAEVQTWAHKYKQMEDEQAARHELTNDALEQLSTKVSAEIAGLSDVAKAHCADTQQIVAEYGTESKRLCMDHSDQTPRSLAAALAVVEEGTRLVTNHNHTAKACADTLNASVDKYAQSYRQCADTCVGEVVKFKQDELKTYTPTGSTPSKRTFVYPRVLTRTSPHSSIKKRIREEHEWVDLDATLAVEEVNACDELTPIIGADTDSPLNSTPIEPSNPLAKANKMNVPFLTPLFGKNSSAPELDRTPTTSFVPSSSTSVSEGRQDVIANKENIA